MTANKKQPSAICYVTSVKHNKNDMIKLVVDPGGRLCFDLKQNLPGESFLITNSRTILQEFLAVIKNNNQKLAHDNLIKVVESAYIQQMLSIISLAKKSGDLILGKEKITSFFKKAGIIVQAQDASDKEKFSKNGKIEVCELFDSSQLSKACGKTNINYLLVINQMAELFKRFYNKYNCYVKVDYL